MLAGERVLRVADPQRALLLAARHVHRPARVAEVAPHLTEDRRHRERGEGMAALRIEAIQRLEQSERSDLLQVLEGLRGLAVPSRETAGERHVVAKEGHSRRLVLMLVPPREQLSDVAAHGSGWRPLRGCGG